MIFSRGEAVRSQLEGGDEAASRPQGCVVVEVGCQLLLFSDTKWGEDKARQPRWDRLPDSPPALYDSRRCPATSKLYRQQFS